MNYPPLLLGCTLIFWGIESERLLLAAILAVIIEASHVIKTRYAFAEEDFVKISDLSSLIFLGAIALILLNNPPASFLRIATGWVPLILSPLLIAQLYSTGNTITIGTRLGQKNKAYTHRPIDFRIYYILICVFAAATGNSRSPWFYPLLGGIVFVLLLNNRGKHYSIPSFVVLLSFSLGLGYLASIGMEKTYRYIVHNSFGFLHNYYGNQLADPYKTHVNFGDTGKLKYSGEIIMRVESQTVPPRLFREASFSNYHQGDWFGNQGEFEFLAPSDNQQWDLSKPPHTVGKELSVELNLPKEKGLLAHPNGSFHLASHTIFEIEQHRNGAIKILDSAPVAVYKLTYHPELIRKDDKPDDKNLDIPNEEEYVLQQVIGSLLFTNDQATTKIAALKKYFSSGFTYSLKFVGNAEFPTPLGNFLLNTKRGFCEYYATATTLLLRKLGIPSRYTVGYAVFEKSPIEGKYIVRSRHAHAWAEAYVNGKWVVVDTTPSTWLAADAEQAVFFEFIQDIVNLVAHKYRLFRIGSGRDYTLLFSFIVVGLTGVLVARIYLRIKLEKAGKDTRASLRKFARVETPLTPIVDRLSTSTIKRRPKESFVSWAGRSISWQHFEAKEFAELYKIHLRLRYDPKKSEEGDIAKLKQGAGKYVEELKQL